jgi:hypothetical protein
MRKLLSALGLLLALSAFSTADTSNASITHVFVQKMGTSSVNVLRLRSDNTYEYCRYTKKKINRDFGSYVMTKHTLELETELKKGVVNPLLHKTLYVSSQGLHSSRMDAIRKSQPLVTVNSSPDYQKGWLYNPVTKTEQYASADKPNVATDVPSVPVSPPLKPNVTISTKTNAAPSNAGDIAEQYFIKTAATYSPGYDKMLSTAYCGPDCYSSSVNGQLVAWSKDTSALALFADYETVIHESTHHYNNSEYLVIPGVSIPVTRTELYTSNEFSEMIPKDAPNKIFRYETYVGKNSVVSANVSGIYGMLDEYSAYLNGVRSCLLGARTAAAKKDTALAIRFLSQASGTYEANYEFRLFIAWYLHYANLKHPDIYKALMANNNLRVAFTLIDHEFKKTVLALADEAQLLGYWGTFDTEYYKGVYTKYVPSLLKNEQVWVEQFSVKEVTTENYKNYLRDN